MGLECLGCMNVCKLLLKSMYVCKPFFIWFTIFWQMKNVSTHRPAVHCCHAQQVRHCCRLKVEYLCALIECSRSLEQVPWCCRFLTQPPQPPFPRTPARPPYTHTHTHAVHTHITFACHAVQLSLRLMSVWTKLLALLVWYTTEIPIAMTRGMAIRLATVSLDLLGLLYCRNCFCPWPFPNVTFSQTCAHWASQQESWALGLSSQRSSSNN